MKLCGFRTSNYHNKIRLVLLEKGIAHEEDASCVPLQEDGFIARSPMGKVPFLELDDGRRLCESSVIAEYLEDAHPDKPLLPREPFARAKVRELLQVMELHLELVARRLYPSVFFGRPADAAVNAQVEKDLAKGLRALEALVRLEPYIAGAELTLADCAAFVHLPLVSAATRRAYGRDFLAELPQLDPYLRRLGERPAFARVAAERKAAAAAMGG